MSGDTALGFLFLAGLTLPVWGWALVGLYMDIWQWRGQRRSAQERRHE